MTAPVILNIAIIASDALRSHNKTWYEATRLHIISIWQNVQSGPFPQIR